MRQALLAALLLLLAGATPLQAQIVNTLGGWKEDEPGWSGRLGLTGDLSGGNTNVKAISGAARVQWFREQHRVRILGSFKVEEAQDVRVKEESMTHLRWIVRLTPRIAPFAFSQIQRNPFIRLETRWLLGAGAEFDVSPQKSWTLALGFSPMLETEKIQDSTSGSETRGRFSSFLRLVVPLGDDIDFNAIAFYQPRLVEPTDFRSSLIASLEVPIVGPLDFLLLSTWEHDDLPPEGVEPDDWDLNFGLTLSL
jgi:hypothetical protein